MTREEIKKEQDKLIKMVDDLAETIHICKIKKEEKNTP